MYVLLELHEEYQNRIFLALFKTVPTIDDLVQSQGWTIQQLEDYRVSLERCLASLNILDEEEFDNFVLEQYYQCEIHRLNWGLRKVEFSN